MVPALSRLTPAQLPAYLPRRLPPPPPGDRGYAIEAHATAAAYDAPMHFDRTPLPVDAPVATSRGRFTAELWDGPAGRWRRCAHGLVHRPGAGAGPRARRDGQLPPGQGITWSVGGWSYAVMNSFARAAAAVLPPAGNPVCPGSHGEVVMPIGAGAPDTWASWTEGRHAYEIGGLIMPGDGVARARVRVSLPR